MRKLFWGLCAAIGISAALLVHGSFMIVEQVGSDMLPTVEPGQKVIIYLLEKNFKEGDVVAFEAPYYTVGGSKVMILRIESIENNIFTLVCDASLVEETRMKVYREDILGKAVFYG